MNKAWYGFACLFTFVVTFAASAVTNGCGIYRHAQLPAERIAELRARGPEGLAEALATYDALQRDYARVQQVILDLDLEIMEAAAMPVEDAALVAKQTKLKEARGAFVNINWQLEKWRKAIDQIGGQRTCLVSRLYWYTDLAKAQAESDRTGRPILSLRMLGKLTDEFSCANSRFFRTALYSNKEIGDYLRDNYVLHWQSVRPVPRVTIDFGDGRKLERTLTGNSAHYVLASDGQPLDALPGLYSPHGFQAWLARLEEFHSQYTATAADQRTAVLKGFHRQQRESVFRQWVNDLQQLGGDQVTLVATRLEKAIEEAAKTEAHTPLAVAADRLSETKRRVESPLLQFANFGGPWIQAGMDEGLWRAIANLHREAVKLDEPSQAVLREEFPRATDASRVSVGKWAQEDPILKMVRLFEDSVALDTVRNEYLLHRRIHERFVEGQQETVDALNEWVYAELFLTPSSDPWLGLAPRDIYTALDNGGLKQ